MNYLAQLNEEQIETAETIGSILAYATMFLAIIYLIYLLIYYGMKESKQKDYIKTLNDHDKAVITDYKSIKPFERKKNETKRNELSNEVKSDTKKS